MGMRVVATDEYEYVCGWEAMSSLDMDPMRETSMVCIYQRRTLLCGVFGRIGALLTFVLGGSNACWYHLSRGCGRADRFELKRESKCRASTRRRLYGSDDVGCRRGEEVSLSIAPLHLY